MTGPLRSPLLTQVVNIVVSVCGQTARVALALWGLLNGLGSGIRRKSVEISRKFRISQQALERRPEL